MLLPTREFNDSTSLSSTGANAYPSTTYPLRISNRFGRLEDTGDELWNAVVKRLSTQRFAFRAYDDTYGIDWADIFRHERSWISSNLGRIIKDCLSYDDRIRTVRVSNMAFKIDAFAFRLTINESIGGDIYYG